MLAGLIDGDGTLITNKTSTDGIVIFLAINLHNRDYPMLCYIQSVLKIGVVYEKIKNRENNATSKLVINRTDLQEVLLPLFLYHKIYFLTNGKRYQFNKCMYVLTNNVKKYSEIDESKITDTSFLPSLPISAKGYQELPYFNNWLVGFTLRSKPKAHLW